MPPHGPVGPVRVEAPRAPPDVRITDVLKFLASGEVDTAPVTREVLRKPEPDPLRRPRVHVG